MLTTAYDPYSPRAFEVNVEVAGLERAPDLGKILAALTGPVWPTLVQLESVQEVHGWAGNRLLIRLTDEKRTELAVARERVGELKGRLGL